MIDNGTLNRHSTASYFSGFLRDPTQVANSLQAKKRARQTETRRKRNASQRSAMRTAIKKAIAAVESGDHKIATAAYNEAVPILDRAVTHGIIHKNKAARHKARLNTRIRALQS